MIASGATWSFVGVANGHLKYALMRRDELLGTALLWRGPLGFQQASRDLASEPDRFLLTEMTANLVFGLNNGLISSPVEPVLRLGRTTS